MKPKGIMFKTFIFTTALITLVVLVSFGILYAVLPGYYGYQKNRTLNNNVANLVADISKAETHNSIKPLIAQFCRDNNATVSAFAPNGALLPEMSYPFVMLDDEFDQNFSVALTVRPGGQMLMERSMYIVGSEGTKRIRAEAPEGLFYIRQSPDAQNIVLNYEIDSSIIGNIYIASTLQPIDEAQGVVVSLMPYLLALGILISLVAAYFYSRRLTCPIIRLSETAASMQELAPNISSGISSNDELGMLSKNLDTLYARFLTTLETLQEEMLKVSEMEKSKTDFMRAASHELKTPLAALNGITEGMIDGVGVYADKTKYLGESKKLVDKMTVLVEEILNASKLEHMSEEIKPEPVDISMLTVLVLEDYAYPMAEKRLELRRELKKCAVNTDFKLIKIVLSNIISNAVKYTDNEGIVVISSSDTEFSVENECSGIPEEDLERVFEPFYVLDYSRGRRRDGTGLGLFIVKKNLDALGIRYAIDNTDMGVKFTIDFSRGA